MNRFTRSASLLLASLGFTLPLGLGMALLTLAPQPAAAAASPPKLVPFKITFAITTDRIVIPANPPIQAVRVSWSGQSDLLGPVMGVSAHTNHLGVDGLPISSTDGVGVINGANGDAFFITYRGLIHPPNPPGVFPYEFAFNITGGTGRFTGATGSGTLTGVTDIPHKLATDTMEGMISAPQP
jgi:hypothetical protein